jgi:hypothetical protein
MPHKHPIVDKHRQTLTEQRRCQSQLVLKLAELLQPEHRATENPDGPSVPEKLDQWRRTFRGMSYRTAVPQGRGRLDDPAASMSYRTCLMGVNVQLPADTTAKSG